MACAVTVAVCIHGRIKPKARELLNELLEEMAIRLGEEGDVHTFSAEIQPSKTRGLPSVKQVRIGGGG